MLTDTRAMTAEYRLRQWAEILNQQKESGMNVKMYCEEIGIKENQYYYWQRKLREAANRESAKEQSGTTSLIPARGGSPVVWASVDMTTIKAPGSSSATVCTTGDCIKICREGWTVTVEPGFDTETLTEALRAVNRICC